MGGPVRSDERLLVLHGIRLKGLASTDGVATATGLAEDAVVAHAQALADEALAKERSGRVSGWMLTPEGRAHHSVAIQKELAAAGVGDVVDGAYRRFLEFNGDLLGVCTDWQLRDGEVNDHTDAAYDAAVIDRLAELDARARPVVESLSKTMLRYAPYRPRFDAAIEKVKDGDSDWFTKPLIDSYHTVWFELHEDLLTTLGIPRESEGPSA